MNMGFSVNFNLSFDTLESKRVNVFSLAIERTNLGTATWYNLLMNSIKIETINVGLVCFSNLALLDDIKFHSYC